MFCNGKMDEIDRKVVLQEDRIQFMEEEDEESQNKIMKQSIETIMTIVTRVIMIVALIIEES